MIFSPRTPKFPRLAHHEQGEGAGAAGSASEQPRAKNLKTPNT